VFVGPGSDAAGFNNLDAAGGIGVYQLLCSFGGRYTPFVAAIAVS